MRKVISVALPAILAALPFLLLWLYLAWQQSTKHTFGTSFYLITLSLLAMAIAIMFIVAVEKCCGRQDK